MSVARRTLFVPFAVAFVLGVAVTAFGLFFALDEVGWDAEARITEARVVDKYIKPARAQTGDIVDSRIVYEFDAGKAGLVRGETFYAVGHGWQQVTVGDRLEIEYLPDGDSRLLQTSTAIGWLIFAGFGILLMVVGGPVALGLVMLEFRARRLTKETLAAAFNPYPSD